MTLTMDKVNPIALDEEARAKVRTLIRASHRTPMDLEQVVPWEQGLDLSKPPKRPDGCWIYGTRHWDALTEVQRNELLWKEVARDVSMFIWLEQGLPPLYVNYVNQYPFELLPEVYEYLMIFSKEEITHTLMFRRYLDLAGLKVFNPPSGAYAQFVSQLPTMHPVVGILFTLVVEWIAEANAVFLTQEDGVEPLTRKMFHEHHIEEVRHIAFGKRVVEQYFATAPQEVLAPLRAQFGAALRSVKAEVTYNAEIASHTSFPFPVSPDDHEEIARIRDSENNRRLNAERFAEVDKWFSQLGIA